MGRSSTRSSSLCSRRSFRCRGGRGYPVEPRASQKKYLQGVHPKHADEKLPTVRKLDEKYFVDDKKRIKDLRSDKMALHDRSRDDKKRESKEILYFSKPTKGYDNNSPKKKCSEKEIEELIFKYKNNDTYESARKKKYMDRRHTHQDTKTHYDSLSYNGNVLFPSEDDSRGVYFDRGASAATMAATTAATSEPTTAPTTAADGEKMDDYSGLSPSSRRRHDLRGSPSRGYYHRVSEHTDYCKRDSIISDLSCATGFLPCTYRGEYDREEGATRGGRVTTSWRDSHRCTSLNSDDNHGDISADYSKCKKKRLSGNVMGDSCRRGMDHMNGSGKSTHLGNKKGEEIDLTGEYSDEESKGEKMCHNYSKGGRSLYKTFLNLTDKYEKIKNKEGSSDTEGFRLDETNTRSRIKSCNRDEGRQDKLIRDPLRNDKSYSTHFYKSRDYNFDESSAPFYKERNKQKYADVADIENYVKGYDVRRSSFSRRDSNHKGQRVFKGVPCFDDMLKHRSDESCNYEVSPIRKGHNEERVQGSSWDHREGGKIIKSLRGTPIKTFSPHHTLEDESFRRSVTKGGKNSPTNVHIGDKINPCSIDKTKIPSHHFNNTQLRTTTRSHDSNDCSTLYDYVNYSNKRISGYCDSDAHLNSSPGCHYPSGVNDACAKSRDRFSSVLSKIQTKKNNKNDNPNCSSHFKSTALRGSCLDGDCEMFPLHSYATKNTHLEKSYKGDTLPSPRGRPPSRRSHRVEEDLSASKFNMQDVDCQNISDSVGHAPVGSIKRYDGRSYFPPNDFCGDTNDVSYRGKCCTGELPPYERKQSLRNPCREKKHIKNLLSYVCDEGGGGERDEFLKSIGHKYLYTQGEELLNSILNLKKMKSSRQVAPNAEEEGGYNSDGSKEHYENERNAHYHSWKCNPAGKSSKDNMRQTASFQYLKNRSYTRPMRVGDFDVGDAEAAHCGNGMDDRDCADLYDHGYSGEYGEEYSREHSGQHNGKHTDKEQRNRSRQGPPYCRDFFVLLFLYLLKILHYLLRYLIQFALLLMVYFYHMMRTKSLATIFISVLVAIPLFLFLLSVLILFYRSVNTEFFDRDI
ncbi:hypothetical protein AK88_00554 [Plasmodium fragile]|uniref:Uncharacterized protein n=1 Tax=Plasmodium fragile TaxID=5857 RepID=A0A0D9QSD3_PLAFR|nr:uncharacterized protein AK88_00554 [Plasmodium fragile]KJP89843.1 hypothetical protein AK88_00554 [Plasmodium fragile]